MLRETEFFEPLGINVTSASKNLLLKDADFDFGVVERDIYFMPTIEDGFTRLKNRKVIVRKDTNQVLGVTKDSYSVVNMREALSLLDPFIEEEQLSYEYAGTSYTSNYEGLKFWVLLKINEQNYEVTGGDRILPYVLLSNSFDGSSGLSIRSTGIRLQCVNQMYMMLREKTNSLTVRHTGLARKRFIQQGKAWLEKLVINNQKTIKAYSRMNETTLDFSQFNVYLNKVFHNQLKEGNGWRWLDYLTQRYASGDQYSNPYSLYSAYNAITELLTHDIGKNLESRFYNFHWGSNATYNNKAFRYALDLIKW